MKLKPKVFEDAAVKVLRGEIFACDAIAFSDDVETYSDHIKLFEEYFKPKENEGNQGWWELFWQEPRWIALLLCAEIVRDMNRRKA